MDSKYEIWLEETFGYRVVDWGDDLDKMIEKTKYYKERLGRDCKLFEVQRTEIDLE